MKYFLTHTDMKREIKFRVFNGIEMTDNVIAGKFGAFFVNPGAKKDGLDEKDTASLTPFNTKYDDGTHVMQYTGYKDNNDVDIYEGDIISSINGQIKNGIVVFDQGSFWLHYVFECYETETHEEIYRWKNGETLHWPLNRIAVKVMGNIFENAELLVPKI